MAGGYQTPGAGITGSCELSDMHAANLGTPEE